MKIFEKINSAQNIEHVKKYIEIKIFTIYKLN